ncbi:MAG: elongation factor 1-beta [Desulfurococcales archaeon]|nr:elongation factor 1-beta [Desulfurococcales archaeon]MEB3780689.1 elongation factor 1-beta [Desulfurococcales archaeon]
MAEVAVIMRVLPNKVDVDLNGVLKKIEEKLPEGYTVMSHGEEPIAFGLKALKLVIKMPEDVEGGTELLEGIIKDVDDVEEVEIEAVHRLS